MNQYTYVHTKGKKNTNENWFKFFILDLQGKSWESLRLCDKNMYKRNNY